MGIPLFARTWITQSSASYSLVSKDQNESLNLPWEDLLRTVPGDPLSLIRLLVRSFWNPDLGPISLTTQAQSPAGAGLGGSSALGISILGGILKMREVLGDPLPHTEEDLVRWVQNEESLLIHSPAGVQDYWGAVRGGVNLISYPPERGVAVETLPGERFQELGSWLMVYFSGTSRLSGINNWDVYKGFFDKNPQIILSLEEIGEKAWACGQAVREGRVQDALESSFGEWQIRKALWPKIETPETRAIDELARGQGGAWFSRVCGAGGGGAMVIVADPSRQARVREALGEAPGFFLEGGVAKDGLRVELIPG